MRRAFKAVVRVVVITALLGSIGHESGVAQRQIFSTNALRQSSGSAAGGLVFDHVTVVDVVHGNLVPDQRVVIVGNRIQAVGFSDTVQLPPNADVINAQGKYLIPGLWDMHTHALDSTQIFYPLFIANGVTGIRDAGSFVSLDSLRQWRREILHGTRVGPPRQILSGPPINGDDTGECRRHANPPPGSPQAYYTCVLADSADARRLVDSLKAAGVDMLKTYNLTPATYFALARAARQAGLRLGGHAVNVSALDATDSGANILDHFNTAGKLDTLCADFAEGNAGSAGSCQLAADRLRRHNTWFVPTLVFFYDIDAVWSVSAPIHERLAAQADAFWHGTLLRNNWIRPARPDAIDDSAASRENAGGVLRLMQQANLPILAGTDVASYEDLRAKPPGFSLHAELAASVAEGLTPLAALQSATYNPAQFLNGMDSLGTVASGKLADLVLLDANPLVDITNTTTIRAVVANGRYYDRAALDALLIDIQRKFAGP